MAVKRMILVWLSHALLDGGDGWQNPLLHSEITSLFFYSENLDSETQNNMEYFSGSLLAFCVSH